MRKDGIDELMLRRSSHQQSCTLPRTSSSDCHISQIGRSASLPRLARSFTPAYKARSYTVQEGARPLQCWNRKAASKERMARVCQDVGARKFAVRNQEEEGAWENEGTWYGLRGFSSSSPLSSSSRQHRYISFNSTLIRTVIRISALICYQTPESYSQYAVVSSPASLVSQFNSVSYVQRRMDSCSPPLLRSGRAMAARLKDLFSLWLLFVCHHSEALGIQSY